MVLICDQTIDIHLHSLLTYRVEFRDVGNDPELEAVDFLGIPFDARPQPLELVSHLLSTADTLMRSQFRKMVQDLLNLMQ